MTAVVPTAIYGEEAWYRNTKSMRAKLDSWHMGIVTAMMHCAPTTSHACLQQELGLLPLHVLVEKHMLTAYCRIRKLPASRLVKQAAEGWTGGKIHGSSR
jgi:hypothetical protein